MDELREQGIALSGYLSVSSDKGKDLYYLLDLETGIKTPAVAAVPPAGEPGWVKHDFSRFYFSDEAIIAAVGILARAAENEKIEVLFVDELGPLELSGHGCLESLRILLKRFDGTVYLVIRKRLLDDFVSVLNLDDPEVLLTDYAQ